MLEKMEGLPKGIVGIKANGTVTKEDYAQVLEPMLEEARREGRRLRFLYQFGPEFGRFTPGAAWEDAKLGLRSLRLFEGCAVVSDVGWIQQSAKAIGFVAPCAMRVFSNVEWNDAVEWLASLPEGAGTSHRLLSDSGVIVVDVGGPLRAQDFDALASTADSWIESRGTLQGMVIHARQFPGWGDLGSFLRHVQFVRDHHKKMDRVALAADTQLASLLPRIAEHFVNAEIRHFGYDDLDSAIAWAKGDAKAAKKPAAAEA